MVAAHDGEHAASMRKLAFLDLFDPSSEDTNWHFMLRFTGGGAGVAADALAIVYDKPKFHVFLARFVMFDLQA